MNLTWIDADGEELELTEDNGFCLLVGTAGLDAPPRQLVTAQRVPHGASLIADRYDARPVVLALDIEDTSANLDARDVVADIAERFTGPGTLRMHRADHSRDLTNVYYESGLTGEEREVPWWQRVAVALLALDPFWYGETVTTSFGPPEGDQAYDTALPYDEAATYDGAASGISGAGATYDAAAPYDEAEPYDGGALFAPALTSRQGAWMTITFHGPATQAKALHLRTGEVVELKAGQSLGDAQELVITTDPTNRDVIAAGTPAWDRVTAESTASMMLLPGDKLALSMSGTSANSYVLVTYGERWLTP